VPGVGPALASRLGAVILRALTAEPESEASPADPIYLRLEAWRTEVAGKMGVPDYVVLPDAVLRAVSARRPETRVDLAGIRGVGPRALAKFADDLLRLVRHEEGTVGQAVAPHMPPG
jgi:ATP-dependent DNA helicase RecQ